jgi:hypothetical protein
MHMRLWLAAIFFSGVVMAESGEPLKKYEVGTYSEMAARPNPQGLTITPIPSLASILLATEKKKGTALTQAEVETVRDNAVVMVSPADSVDAVEDRRGYTDINPSRSWQEWQVLRVQFNH